MEHSAAKETLTKWLQAWVEKDWERMAELTVCTTDEVEGRAPLIAVTFGHRWASSYEEPIFKNGREETPPDDVPIGYADFGVRVCREDGAGTELFTARVVGVAGKWRVNAISTMNRTLEPALPGRLRRKPEEKP